MQKGEKLKAKEKTKWNDEMNEICDTIQPFRNHIKAMDKVREHIFTRKKRKNFRLNVIVVTIFSVQHSYKTMYTIWTVPNRITMLTLTKWSRWGKKKKKSNENHFIIK